MTVPFTITAEQAHALAVAVLVRHVTTETNARSVADALVAAELDGQGGHGLSRLPSYAAQAASGKVDGGAEPALADAGTVAVRIDAANGFAYPALDLAIRRLCEVAPRTGVAVAAIHHSHHCGMAGFHVERLARAGMVGLMFSNTPKAMAPWGGNAALFGTNPVAFAAPRRDAPPLVIDLSLSQVARGKVMVAARQGEPIPECWALDADGNPTTDAARALDGSMVPMGGAKGASLALMVEILSAALTGAAFGFEASSFFTVDGPPPAIGQVLLAVAPGPLSGDAFADRMETLCAAVLGQPGTRLPGDRRLAAREAAARDGIAMPRDLHDTLRRLAGGAGTG